MFKNYFKTAWRNLTRTLGYSLLNVFGLAIGMAVALLIGIWVYYHYSFDKFLPAHSSIYRVQRNYDSNGDTLTFTSTSLKLADALRRQIPETQYVVESDNMNYHGLIVGEKKFYLPGYTAGADFFNMFEFPFVAGNRQSVFADPYSIVITQSLAKSLFGHENAYGKYIRFDNRNNLRVTGIVKDIPGNSDLRFEYVIPNTYLFATDPDEKLNGMRSFAYNTLTIFVRLKPGVRYEQVASKIRDIEHTEKGNVNAMKSYVTLQPLDRWHLYSHYVNGKDTEGFLEYVRMFSIIGVLVLLIACINFVNLTTARSEKRAKEVGLRKTIGSRRSDLIIQFLAEAFVLTTIAFLLAVILASVAIPLFNTLTNSRLSIPYDNANFWMIMIVSLLTVTILAGSRPAFYLSSFEPVKVLKGGKLGGRSSILRKVLVVSQFGCSIALIIGTITIYRQISYARNRPTGLSLNRLMSTYINEDLEKNFTALKQELLSKGIISSATTSTSAATNMWAHSDLDQWPGKNANETVEIGFVVVNEDYFKTTGMAIAQGRDFTGAYDSTSVIFNEAAIKRLRIVNPVNQQVRYGGTSYTIAGVVKDALMASPFKPAEPTMFFCVPAPQRIMLYRLSPQISDVSAIEQLPAIFGKYNPSIPYSFTFADQDYAAKFDLERLIGRLASLFAVLAVVISCLGLFGLAAYVAEQRTREVGIRKVLGATVRQLWYLLSRDFILLVGISCLIAMPVSFYVLHGWLTGYEYRITMGADVFVYGAGLALLITIVTVSFQSIRAAVSNPVKSLRRE